MNKEAVESQESSLRASQLLIDSTHFLHDSFWKTNKGNHTDVLLLPVNSEEATNLFWAAEIWVRVVDEGL